MWWDLFLEIKTCGVMPIPFALHALRLELQRCGANEGAGDEIGPLEFVSLWREKRAEGSE